MEVEAEGGRGGGGAVEREGAGVEDGAAKDVEARGDSDGGEVAEAVAVGVAGHGRKGTPGGGAGVEEVRGGDGGVLGEDAEEVGEVPADAAEGN